MVLKCGRSLEFVWSELLPLVGGYSAEFEPVDPAGQFLLGNVTPTLWKVQQKDRRKHLNCHDVFNISALTC